MEITIKENHEIEFHLNFLEKIQLGLFAIDVGVDALINKVTQTVQDAFHSEIPSILESFQKAQKKCKYLILRKKYLWKTYTSHVARLKEFLLTPEENDFYALIQNLSTNDEISNICLIETFKTVLTIIDVFEQIEETKDEIEDLAKHLQKLNGDKKFLADMRSQIQELNSLITSEMLYGLVPFTQSVLQNKNLLWDLANWINYYDFCLKMVQTKKLKTFPEVDQEEFKTALNQHLEQFPLPQDFNPNNHYGFIEKRQFENSTRIFVRADLHGDLKSLIENLKTLQKKGLLDENYHCRPDVQLVFLGDYADRGDYSLQVLKLLISLHLNNPEQVILIQGNHEDTSINTDYAVNKDPNDPLFGEGDKKLESFLQEEANRNLLDRFYTTLPLAVYAGQKQSNGNCQYTLFTHGLFELHIDPIEDKATFFL